ncbi:MAG: S9 family peptidase [Phycisphaerales bacterium]|nr:MAG: S9 family peptidase [Phycisphaerales bacterium]
MIIASCTPNHQDHQRHRILYAAVFVLLTLAMAVPCPGAEAEQDRSLLTVERIFDSNDFKTESFGPARWLTDRAQYATLEESETDEDVKDMVYYDPQSGERTVVVPAAKLIPPSVEANDPSPLQINDYAWSEDATRLLIFTNSKRVWRRNTRGDYWVYDTIDETLTRLGGNAEPSRMMFAKFSPDGTRVAYVYQNDIYVQHLHSLRIKQLTRDGSDLIINGTSDWVNEEELYIRDGFRWSPDGRFIAYWQFNTEGVKEFTLIDYTSELYPKLKTFQYPKAGQQNSAVRIGVVSAAGGKTRWLKLPGDPREHYVHALQWRPDSSDLVLQQLNRLQNTNCVFVATVDKLMLGGTRVRGPELVFTDTDEAWVEVDKISFWLDEGDSFLYLSERDGWSHLYRVHRVTGDTELLTPGEYDVVSVVAVDEQRGWIYFMASPENPTQRYLYRVPLTGGAAERVTPLDQPGTHRYQVSEDATWAIHTYSAFGRAPTIDMVRLPEYTVARTLETNDKLRENLAALQPCPREFFRVDANGVALDGWCIRPPDFDPQRQYPLFLHVYGEPAGQTVLDRWTGNNYLWHTMLAQQGYLVASVDNRGTPAPRGRRWRKSIYRQIGILASADQAAATRQLTEQWPFVDPNRIGIWGWSGGGSMTLNAILRYPGLYQTGIAVAFVSNQRFYDTIYQERYMGLPSDNEEGYTKGSVVNFADQLEGNLLLVYGTGDDNCHYQNCQVLINKLIEHNKPFAMMAYPNRTHGISEGKNTRRHLYEMMTRYLHEHLPVDTDSSPAETSAN